MNRICIKNVRKHIRIYSCRFNKCILQSCNNNKFNHKQESPLNICSAPVNTVVRNMWPSQQFMNQPAPNLDRLLVLYMSLNPMISLQQLKNESYPSRLCTRATPNLLLLIPALQGAWCCCFCRAHPTNPQRIQKRKRKTYLIKFAG